MSVTDSRPVAVGTRRRIKCNKCGDRITTYEVAVAPNTAILVHRMTGKADADADSTQARAVAMEHVSYWTPKQRLAGE